MQNNLLKLQKDLNDTRSSVRHSYQLTCTITKSTEKRLLKSPVTQQPLKVQRIVPNGFTLVNLTNIPPLHDLLSDTDKSSTAPDVSNIVKKPARRSLAFTGSSESVQHEQGLKLR